MITVSDQELVTQALRDPQVFSVIVERYQAPLRRYIIRLGCRNDEDVNDLLQDIFLKIYMNMNMYDERLKFSSWIYRCAHNETVSFFRKKSVRPLHVWTKEELSIFDNIIYEGDIIKEVDREINMKHLNDALATMDSKYQDVLMLKFFEDKSYDEISDILKIPAGTVAVRMNRGKGILKKAMILKGMHI